MNRRNPLKNLFAAGASWCWFVLLGGGLLVSGCATGTLAERNRVAATPRLAILSAFAPELETLRKSAELEQTQVINGRTHYLAKLGGQEVVMTLSGESMVNAAMTAQEVIDHFKVREIIFSGIAGGVNPNLHIGDVTVPAQWGQYQEQVFARATADGWDPGSHRGSFTNYGMMFARDVQVTRRAGDADVETRQFWFPCDAASVELIKRVAGTVKLNRCTAAGDCLDTEPRVIVGGNGVSGPTFVDNADYRQFAWDTFHVDALDMETAAVAQVAYVNQVPYVAFRSLSDLAGGGQGQNEVSTFFQLAADNSAAVVMAYLTALNQTPNTFEGATAAH